MVFTRLKSGLTVNDEEFDSIYSKRLKKVSEFHFTPVDVAQTAATFLVREPGTRVLDIGSGAGKFCMVGASCTPGFFVGVEQRKTLVQQAEQLAKNHHLVNTKFIHSNITDIEFQPFDAIYFFNAFHENLFQSNPIDDSVTLEKPLYKVYSEYVKGQLEQMPAGTRLATYFSFTDEIPACYTLLSAHFDRKLKFWEKTN
ncbi:MAG: methyltransferase domain-containing protein [Saprospiraceae bacterium]|nr:methyltransferase domain-containing protein [Saprospiraceae bacterium]